MNRKHAVDGRTLRGVCDLKCRAKHRVEGGNTLWVQGPEGGTILRLKVTGRITSTVCDTSPIAHADAAIQGDLVMCIPKKRRKAKPASHAPVSP